MPSTVSASACRERIFARVGTDNITRGKALSAAEQEVDVYLESHQASRLDEAQQRQLVRDLWQGQDLSADKLNIIRAVCRLHADFGARPPPPYMWRPGSVVNISESWRREADSALRRVDHLLIVPEHAIAPLSAEEQVDARSAINLLSELGDSNSFSSRRLREYIDVTATAQRASALAAHAAVRQAEIEDAMGILNASALDPIAECMRLMAASALALPPETELSFHCAFYDLDPAFTDKVAIAMAAFFAAATERHARHEVVDCALAEGMARINEVLADRQPSVPRLVLVMKNAEALARDPQVMSAVERQLRAGVAGADDPILIFTGGTLLHRLMHSGELRRSVAYHVNCKPEIDHVAVTVGLAGSILSTVTLQVACYLLPSIPFSVGPYLVVFAAPVIGLVLGLCIAAAFRAYRQPPPAPLDRRLRFTGAAG